MTKTAIIIAALISSICTAAVAKLPENYQSYDGTIKQWLLWQKIVASEYHEEERPQDLTLVQKTAALANMARAQFMANAFLFESDEAPLDRLGFKPFHSFGSVAKVRFIIYKKTQYTGLFERNLLGVPGIARLSLATPSGDFTPGMGLKLLVDGQPSQNIMVMHSLDGQGSDTNFFANDFSNKVEQPKSLLLRSGQVLFEKGRALINLLYKTGLQDQGKLKSSLHLPIQHFSEVRANGSSVDQAKSPEIVIFRPKKSVANLISSTSQSDFRDDLSRVKPQVVYSVIVKETLTSTEEEIGVLVFESWPLASAYGDEVLFFQHGLKR